MANFKLFHNNPNLETLKDFADSYKIRLNEKFSLKDFFEYNKDVIFKQLSPAQLNELSKIKKKQIDDLSSNDIDENIVLPCPCYLFIDEKYVDYSLATKHTNFQVQEIDFTEFLNRQIKEIYDNESSNPYYKTVGRNDKIMKIKPGCKVIGWFKSLYYIGKKGNNEIQNIYDSESNFIDITPFIIQLNTNVMSTGGNFSLTLPNIPFYKESLLAKFSINRANNEAMDKNQMSDFFIDNDKEVNVKSEFSSFNYFEWLIQHNDLLFISFEDIEELKSDNIFGNYFDMIALVDEVTVNRNSQNSEVTVTVTGRDLMKLITDDASIFFPAGVAASDGRIFDNTETTMRGGDQKSLVRYKGTKNQDGSPRQLTHMINVFAEEPNNFSIDFVLKTVISHLANLQIVPDDLFFSWGDERTTFNDFEIKK